jgi:hypothetical protein
LAGALVVTVPRRVSRRRVEGLALDWYRARKRLPYSDYLVNLAGTEDIGFNQGSTW